MVVQAALQLLNEVGMDGLTTRRLAQALGVQGPALYWHFKNKQELLDDMARSLLEGAYGPLEPGQDWTRWIVAGAREVSRRLLSYRDGARILAGFRPSKPMSRLTVAPWIAPLKNAGFSEQDALWAMLTIGLFTFGWTMDEQAAQDRNVPVSHKIDPDTGFEFGLQTILLGLKARLAAGHAAQAPETAEAES